MTVISTSDAARLNAVDPLALGGSVRKGTSRNYPCYDYKPVGNWTRYVRDDAERLKEVYKLLGEVNERYRINFTEDDARRVDDALGKNTAPITRIE